MQDAVIVGSGPNGLAAAVTLALAGRSVVVLEAEETIGGGARSAELTLPGFLHDLCSAVHPLAVASPFFQSLPLERHGLKWIRPPIPLAHPFDDGSAACLFESVDETAETLGPDAEAYRKWMRPFLARWKELFEDALRPVHIPRHPLALLRFGFWGLRSAEGLANRLFRGPRAKGLFAGLAAHSLLPLSRSPSAAIGLTLAVAGHAVGWPFPQGGSQKISEALSSYLQELGGKVLNRHRVRGVEDIPPARSVFFDLNPLTLLRIAGDRLSRRYRRRLQRLRLGPGVFKMDWALSGPVPWAAEACRRAGTVHLGGTIEEIAASEKAPWEGVCSSRPFVLLSQPSLFDPTRAPEGRHTLWAYVHVPFGSSEDMTERIESQIERFAPGFRRLILAKRTTTPSDFERHNANYIGGDISGGVPDLWQLLFRPTLSLRPYATSEKNWYLCSASTPPGPGIHGMCGYHAARFSLRSGL